MEWNPMSDGAAMEKLTQVFRDVLDEPDLRLARDTTAADVDGWDSLAHIQLMVAVERAFGIKLTTGEIANLADVGELLDLVVARSGS